MSIPRKGKEVYTIEEFHLRRKALLKTLRRQFLYGETQGIIQVVKGAEARSTLEESLLTGAEENRQEEA